VADRRRNRDLPQLRSWRDIAHRALLAVFWAGAVAGWAFVLYALRVQLTGA